MSPIAFVQKPGRWLNAIARVKRGGLPRSSSGKIQRSQCRQQFLNEELAVVEVWRSPESHDISSLIGRYLNLRIHLMRLAYPLRVYFDRGLRRSQ